MASMTIRKLDDGVKAKLRIRAAREGRSMEATVREILSQAVNDKPRGAQNLAEAIRRRVEPLGGFELEPYPRSSSREPPKFD